MLNSLRVMILSLIYQPDGDAVFLFVQCPEKSVKTEKIRSPSMHTQNFIV